MLVKAKVIKCSRQTVFKDQFCQTVVKTKNYLETDIFKCKVDLDVMQ